jgi:hypothetical protein
VIIQIEYPTYTYYTFKKKREREREKERGKKREMEDTVRNRISSKNISRADVTHRILPIDPYI